MSEHYLVRVSDDALVFSAAHFIIFGQNRCERLHGHDYRATAEVAGPLDENSLVVDFIFLRKALRGILKRLDHRVLLPTEHPFVEIVEKKDTVQVSFAGRRWSFPPSDCLLLPIANTTAELLARYLGQSLHAALARRAGMPPEVVQIELGEGYGQSAVWRWTKP